MDLASADNNGVQLGIEGLSSDIPEELSSLAKVTIIAPQEGMVPSVKRPKGGSEKMRATPAPTTTKAIPCINKCRIQADKQTPGHTEWTYTHSMQTGDQ